MSATVFLGGGRITAALVAGLRRARFRGRIVVCDRHPGKLRRLRREFGVETESDPRRAAEHAAKGSENRSTGLLLIAVRPEAVLPLLAAAGPLPRRTIVVSLAAGVPLSDLRCALGTHTESARAMPSPAARVGLGLTALAFDPTVRPRSRRRVLQFFERVGQVVEIPEGRFDAFTVAYSTSQGYQALRARVHAARRLGLDARTAFLAVAHSLADGIRSLPNAEAMEAALVEAATPGGIAARVMKTMQAAGYERIVETAFRAGLAHARRTGRRRYEARSA